MKRFQEGGLAEAVTDPATGYLGLLASQYETSPEAQDRAREILNLLMSDEFTTDEDELIQQFRDSSEEARAALRQARETILSDQYNPAQIWLAAAQGFGAPTRTGSFGETLGNVAGLIREPLAEQDEFRRAQQAQVLGIDERMSQIDQDVLANEFALKQLRRKMLSDLGQEALKTLGKRSTIRPYTPPGVAARDREMAKTLNDWVTQGRADAYKSFAELEEAIGGMEESDTISGPLVGLIPKKARDVILPQSGSIQDLIETIAQRSLRLVLGAQFTQREGEMLLARTFNPRLQEGENIRRAFRLLTMLRKAAESKDQAAEYFAEHGTMAGFQGKANWTIEDFEPPPILKSVRMEDGTIVQVPEEWGAKRIREWYSQPVDEREKFARGGRTRFSKGGSVKRLIDKLTGKIIHPGDTIKSFRGEDYIFKYISRNPEPGEQGKIIVEHVDAPREMRRYGLGQEEFYPSVFEAFIDDPRTRIRRIKARGGRIRYQEGGVVDIGALGDEDTTTDEDDNSALQEILSMLAGATGGGAMGVGLEALGTRLNDLRRGLQAPSRGEQMVADALQVQNIDPRAMTDEVKRGRRMGVPELPLDQSGRLGQELGERALMAGGQDAEEALRMLEERHEGSTQRVGRQVEKGLRASEFFSQEQKLTDRLYSRAKEAYRKAYAENPSIKMPPFFHDLVDNKYGRQAMEYALELLELEGKQMGRADAIGMVRRPTLEFLDMLKRGFDQLIVKEEANGPTPLGRALRQKRKQLVRFLDNPDNVTPAYAAARKQYKGDLEVLDALQLGREDFHRMAPEQLKSMIDDMSFAEKDALRTGVAQHLYEVIYGPSTDIKAARRIIGSPETKERLKLLFEKPREWRIFEAALQREMEMFDSGKKMVARAERGRTQQMTEDLLSMDDPLSVVKEKIGRGPLMWAIRFLPSFRGKRKPIQLTEKEADEIVRILTTGDVKELDRLGDRLKHVQSRARFRRGRRNKAAMVGSAVGAALAALGFGAEEDGDEVTNIEDIDAVLDIGDIK